MDLLAPAAVLGRPLQRLDGHQKLTGEAKYAAEFSPDRLCFAWLVQSTIANGQLENIDLSEARQAPGVIGILTRENMPRLQDYPEELTSQGLPCETRVPLQDKEIHWQGDILGVVMAESLEQARFAASRVRARYREEAPLLSLNDPLAQATFPPLWGGREELQVQRGDFNAVFTAAPDRQKVRATYSTPIENHNPIELASTTAEWTASDSVILYATVRGIKLTQQVVSHAFRLPPDHVRVVCPFLGGHFGSKGFTWGHLLLTVAAAQLVQRPVRLTFSRPQMFDSLGQRARTEQTVGLVADKDGKLLGLQHAISTHCSPPSSYAEPCGTATRTLYSFPNLQISHRLLHLNYTTPCPMRAPGEAPGVYAVECAIDELAEKLAIDPLQFRLNNIAEHDTFHGRPWSSKHLRECYVRAAESFGWSARNPVTRSMRDAAGRALGWGMATAIYPANQMPAEVKIALQSDGTVILQTAAHESGTGAYTTMTQFAADSLGIPIEQIQFELGDSSFPPAPVNGGSWQTASVGSAVLAACEELKKQLAKAGSEEPDPVWPSGSEVSLTEDAVFLRQDKSKRVLIKELLARKEVSSFVATGKAKPSEEHKSLSFYSFGALFVEVAVDLDFGTVSVRRVSGVYDVGRILNPPLARSQLIGAITFGIGMALLEQTIPDPVTGRMVNPNLAEYHVPVFTDTPPLFDIDFIGVPDPHMASAGARGLGEIGISGLLPPSPMRFIMPVDDGFESCRLPWTGCCRQFSRRVDPPHAEGP